MQFGESSKHNKNLGRAEILDSNDRSTVPIGRTKPTILFRRYDYVLISIRLILTTSSCLENSAH